jgi:SAM-dependent methyltransferase
VTSPYLAPGFYDRALAAGKHRDIVGGRWDETARAQMAALLDEGLLPSDLLLDIGCGSLRLGHKAVAYLAPGHYWGTDASLALMHRGWEVELTPEMQTRLPMGQLIQDADFAFPGVPAELDLAIAFGVFTHLPATSLAPALLNLRERLPRLRKLLLTVFLCPAGHAGPLKQPDGVVTHPDRPPYHRPGRDVAADAEAAGFALTWRDRQLPRGQRLAVLDPR